MLLVGVAAFALLAWAVVLALPWQPHRTRERLEPDAAGTASDDLADVCVLIPARDEAPLIERTIAALRVQGANLQVLVVDDQSTDGTAAACERAAAAPGACEIELRVVPGAALSAGWAGKLWALQQGLALVQRPFTLLLDADIELAPGVVAALKRRAAERGAALVSVMAELHCTTFAEKLLTPPFVFFFKLLYPFALANDHRRGTAAAAGGCMLVRTAELRALGGFVAIRGALIDDCSLAALLKHTGGKIWLGMSHSVRSLRVYGFRDFWRMVSRSAFTQLQYSAALLLVATALMIATLLGPPLVIVAAAGGTPALGIALAALAWLAMSAAYWPTVRFYGLTPAWALTLPVAGALFLAMTWSSAVRYWRGTRATWKNRSYESSAPRTDRRTH